MVRPLAGNKCDLKEEREVTYLEASRFALENGPLQHAAATCRCNMPLQHAAATCRCNMPLQHAAATCRTASRW
jgi:hypothetical protein